MASSFFPQAKSFLLAGSQSFAAEFRPILFTTRLASLRRMVFSKTQKNRSAGGQPCTRFNPAKQMTGSEVLFTA
ncbi:hypothetical protein [Paenibacillus chitinolyticus]|uniref:hypothetical protein n=1 Tax=Paenibacillus chitinolyticus TaxID=79263 RepID=UPI003670BAFB